MRQRLRDESGFGLIELIAAMTILVVGLLAIVAAYSSGAASLVRAGRVGTASTLADKQLELFRAGRYASVALNPSTIPTTAPYTTDSAYTATQVTDPACTGVECTASQTVTGPDGHSYRIDTYVMLHDPTGSGLSRDVKKVTVVVRNPNDLTATPLARQISTFDQLSG